MAIRHMLCDTVTILNRVKVDDDPLGRAEYGWVETETKGFLAERKGTDLPTQGEVAVARRILYLESSVTIRDGDRVRDEQGNEWTVAGPPLHHKRPWLGPHHIEADLELVEGK